MRDAPIEHDRRLAARFHCLHAGFELGDHPARDGAVVAQPAGFPVGEHVRQGGGDQLQGLALAVPALASFNVDLIWFGILTIIAVEIGLLTPPLGLACFVIHNNLQDDRISVEDIFWGAAPFALTMVIVLVLVTLVPQIATLLL